MNGTTDDGTVQVIGTHDEGCDDPGACICGVGVTKPLAVDAAD